MYAEFQLHTLYYFDAERVKREHLIIYQTRVFHKAKRVHPVSCKNVQVLLQNQAPFYQRPTAHGKNLYTTHVMALATRQTSTNANSTSP